MVENAQKLAPKICMTAAGFLVHDNKVLLVKHKKLGFWLAPGGHIEDDELPHQTAEREFWEETGIKVKAISTGEVLPKVGKTSYHPLPFAINLHWISPENYEARLASSNPIKRYFSNQKWPKGCEQHVSIIYLVKLIAGLDFKQNTEETDGIGWFTLKELEKIKTIPEMKEEAKHALILVK
ncbi:MAG: hypothetical protein A2383_01095 [Candidatus Pacebacteria bacterium RIFOXYB1_FULL_39_46]|nr:MAG: hypothetical protein A2182_00930 [Candidatus Pacebacteria bacterium RIFOXYA1_FULL_38_18]OGJ38177.1 MAG: hypothetical protein A2383_01095 [Candidatus Pacebacteria bacterium RIFOXYB1_FULL_39_46]OGJ39602.1 MAG: hypothetical protein A2411_02345 [Candidatus Pacebacteria bacterium RIFOXYC1_FULL_39_21]OGJ39929.1 MAG: hypothetical protein A2582_00860 [Candidatus Pacebacteria bacterium RIFOXYD1_FULL_39_27]